MSKKVDLTEFRARIGALRGREYWRSLEELSRDPSFDDFVHDEFPQHAAALDDGLHRRDFVKLMGASVALAGLTACNRPAEQIIPYIKQPEDLIPGQPLFFASAMPLRGVGTGVLVESHMGRPTKIEGNPDHPSSLGASDSLMQGSILGLYDPDRSQVVRHLGEVSTWSEFIALLQPALKTATTNGGTLRLLTQTVTSPTLGAQIRQLLGQYPGMQWHQWEPVSGDNERAGLRLAFGGDVHAVYHFDKANVVVSLDSAFTDEGPGHLRYARDFADRRRVRQGVTTSINRLYAIESFPTGVGALADHRIAVRQSEVASWARAVAAGLGLGAAAPAGNVRADWVAAVVRDLQKNRGASIVIAGEDQPPEVHAVAMAINQAMGNIGSTLTITDPVEVAPVDELESLRQLVADMNNGAVKALIVLGGNPVFDAPADFGFMQAYKRVPFRAHLSLYYDETSILSHWHIPETHYLESWSDVRGHEGTISIIQPLIAPLYNGRSPHEVLGALIGGLDVTPYDQVRGYWTQRAGLGAAFEDTWRKWLNDGVIGGSALPAKSMAASTSIPPAANVQPPAAGLELQLRPDPTIYDGRFANIAWLQELPKPQTKITWENVLLVSPNTADAIGWNEARRAPFVNERSTILADVAYRGRKLRVPLWVVAGHPDGCATLHFGYGRVRGGRVASPPEGTVGVDVYPFRMSEAMNGGPGAQIVLTGEESYHIGCTQEHQDLNATDVGGDRAIIREASFEEYRRNPNFVLGEGAVDEKTRQETIYPTFAYTGHAWAMVIDQSVCTGCNGCVIACQSENNIATVGKDQVWREREMHWLRIDRYYKGTAEEPKIYHQPIPCMQCEQAPCEPVCPVEATAHSAEGLNDMTYNRCVGTRYCANNCPYKVRRFNFYFYSDYDTPALEPMRNPDVTVRTRGVMEKCTYCVQRINAAKIKAERENRPVRDGEILTACQQACPTQAIVFGDKNDPNSAVASLKKEPTNYALLEVLNTRPRTTYLGVIRNPNPEIKEG
ncbi:MAG TPA: TAT-variant-translocated molybdopterin oxidoreductase [Thermoanaerobaculia bacterium]|nr:TAT-variant-translocated molybdopterin oxidoreductase [Thermoanaerobaculia bacterium]